MKIYVVITTLLVAMLIFPIVIAKTTPNVGELDILIKEISPEPVEPGQEVTVKITLTNPTGAFVENIMTRLDIKRPFKLKQPPELEEFPGMCAGCSRDITYYLIVEGGAPSGIYDIDFEILVKGGAYGQKQEISIKVTGTPDVVFHSEPLKNPVKPNQEFTTTFSVENVGTSIARKVKIIPESDDFIKLGSSLAFIETLPPQTKKIINLDFIVADSVEPNAYNIPFRLEYTDNANKQFNKTEKYGIKVVNGAQINLQNIKINPSPPSTSRPFELQVRMENVGEGDAENVKLTLDSKLEGTKTAYLGRIERDDDEPTIFTLSAGKQGNIENTLKITYDDDFGSHTSIEEFTIVVSNGANTTLAIAILIILMVIAYISYRKNKSGA